MSQKNVMDWRIVRHSGMQSSLSVAMHHALLTNMANRACLISISRYQVVPKSLPILPECVGSNGVMLEAIEARFTFGCCTV